MIKVIPLSYKDTGARLHESTAPRDAAELERVINEQEAKGFMYVGFIPQGRNYESLQRHVHLIFRFGTIDLPKPSQDVELSIESPVQRPKRQQPQ